MRFRAALPSAALAILIPAAGAEAGMVFNLGGGWQAEVFDPGVFLFTDAVGEDFIEIQKVATFTKIDGFSGQPAPIHIAFRQLGDDEATVPRIIFNDMLLTNNTGQKWTSFREVLIGDGVAFNPEASDPFSINPFTQLDFLNDNTEAFFSGGSVQPGETWAPGTLQGGLVIDIDLSPVEPVKFVVKEMPLVPAPGALALLGGGLLLGTRRPRGRRGRKA